MLSKANSQPVPPSTAGRAFGGGSSSSCTSASAASIAHRRKLRAIARQQPANSVATQATSESTVSSHLGATCGIHRQPATCWPDFSNAFPRAPPAAPRRSLFGGSLLATTTTIHQRAMSAAASFRDEEASGWACAAAGAAGQLQHGSATGKAAPSPHQAAAAAELASAVALSPGSKRTSLQDDAADAITGLLLTSPTKKVRPSTDNDAATAPDAANKRTVAGYSPELSKALKSVVKIFTTMARWGRMPLVCLFVCLWTHGMHALPCGHSA